MDTRYTAIIVEKQLCCAAGVIVNPAIGQKTGASIAMIGMVRERMEEGNMKQIHKIIALVSVPFLLIGCGTEQTTAPDPEPLVINTVEDQDDMLLTVIREDETVFQERRDRKEMKADQQRHYEGLEELPVSRKAKERFRRPAYQARGMIREQGRQMERMSADKYLANKLDSRG